MEWYSFVQSALDTAAGTETIITQTVIVIRITRLPKLTYLLSQSAFINNINTRFTFVQQSYRCTLHSNEPERMTRTFKYDLFIANGIEPCVTLLVILV